MRNHVMVSAVAVLTLGAIALPSNADAKGGVHVRTVRIQDRCDPASFDAAIGPGTCVPHDGELVTFTEFLAQLNPVDFGHDQWKMHPDEIELTTGDSISASVRGGEFHTFTEVEAFGAGCIDLLNGPLGLTGPPSADCATNLAPVFAGGTGTAPGLPPVVVSGLAPGTHLFMCLIHPWMQAVVDVIA